MAWVPTRSRLVPALLVGATLGLALAAAPGAAQESQDPPPVPAVRPVHFVVMVDESGSLRDDGPDKTTSIHLEREKQAAGILAIGDLSPESQVAVAGFGSSTTGQSDAVDVVCEMQPVVSPERATCVDKLALRTEQQGDFTDIPAAIRQGVNLLGSAPSGTPRILFLLTDGKMEVGPGQGYGTDVNRIPAAMDRALTDALAEARAKGVQIWPLGFGDSANINPVELDRIAAGGAPGTCPNRPELQPAKQIVPDSSAVGLTLQQAFATARCGGLTPPDTKTVPGGGEADLYVDIPPIATDVTIQVTKEDARIEVTWFDPKDAAVPAPARPADVRGQGTVVEALQVSDPLPGRWRIHLKAPPGVSGPVTARALWQGVIRSYVELDPPRPMAGDPVDLSVFLQTRKGALADPGAVDAVRVEAIMEAPGGAPVRIALSDTGTAPDRVAGDGEFTGTVTIPQGTVQPVKFTGRVNAEGVQGDEQVLTVTPRTGPAPVSASLELDSASPRVPRGGTVRGTVEWRVTDGKPHTLRITPEFPSGVPVGFSPVEHRLDGVQDSFGFELKIGKGAPDGLLSGRLTVVDTADGTEVAAKTVRLTVVPPPGFWDENLWWVLLAAGLVVVAVVGSVLRARRRRRDARIGPIVLQLYLDGRPIGVPARPFNDEAARMWFRLDGASAPPSLSTVDAQEDGCWTVRRSRSHGGLELDSPIGVTLRLAPGQLVELESGLSLGFTDSRLEHPGGPEDGHQDPLGGPYGGPFGAPPGGPPDGGPDGPSAPGPSSPGYPPGPPSSGIHGPYGPPGGGPGGADVYDTPTYGPFRPPPYTP
ncbi:VWA domain-containing protein [Streptomycetaceae bacterium NBC_01309]